MRLSPASTRRRSRARSSSATPTPVRSSDEGSAPHPDGTEVDPRAWWDALQAAIDAAGGIDDVDAVAVGGQQHGMVCLDEAGEVVRPALLWNDTRSAQAAEDLIADLGGGEDGQTRLGRGGRLGPGGVVHRDQAALAGPARARQRRPGRRRLPAARLPDLAAGRLDRPRPARHRSRRRQRHRVLVTGHGRVSRSTCWSLPSAATLVVPRVLAPHEVAGRTPAGAVLGPGTGDNAAAALGLGAASRGRRRLDRHVRCRLRGLASARLPTHPGLVAGFADATGRFLPLVATLNAARVLDAAASCSASTTTASPTLR